MRLRDLLNCDSDVEITRVTDDSREVIPGTLFVAVKGLTVDGHKFIPKALESGASALLVEDDVTNVNVPVIKVDNTVRVMNEVLNRFYGDPLNKLKLIGVTGTDGKTTTSEMMFQILNMLSKKTGYIGTNGIRSEHYQQENDYTTPLQGELFKALNGFVADDVKYVSMEATGERLGTGKMEGITFDVSIFTNLTRDALDIFKTMENYGNAKAKLMQYTKPSGLCIINADDPYKDLFIKAANASVVTYGIDNKADVFATNIEIGYQELHFDIDGKFGRHHIDSKHSGRFNVYNIMAVITALSYFGISVDEIIKCIEKLAPIEARQTTLDFGQPFRVIVDYAHTANAVANLITYLRETLVDGTIKVVVGAGGSRDIHRRTDMAEYCTANVDYSYFTIEDARFEDPQMLVETMVSTVPNATNYELIVDRDEAITKAIKDAVEGDTVIILGKGAERYMMTNGKPVERPNDIERAEMVLHELGYK